jgi:putative ABC transport system permease protein
MTGRTAPPSRADRLFRALLRLLPLDFRSAHGREMEQVFRAQRGDARGGGTLLTLARLWIETVQDILTTAPREHVAVLRQDVAYALRSLAGAPAFSAAAILTLSIGIGATTSLFTLLNAFLFRPLPVHHPEELVSIATLDHHIELPHGLSLLDLDDYRPDNAAFVDLLGYAPAAAAVNAGGGAERVAIELVTPNYFSMLGVPPEIGRVFAPAEARAAGDAPLMVLSHDYWRARFGEDPSVVGRAVRVNGRPFTIVGVAAAGFASTESLLNISAYVPVSMADQLEPPTTAQHSILEARDQHSLRALGRLRPGVSLARARAVMAVKAAALARRYPDTNKDVSLLLVPETSARPEPATGPWFRVAAGAFTLLAVLLLAITSANIANMLLARAATRGREVAIRAAMGARRGRIVRQLLTEGIVLACIGGIVAVPLAWAVTQAFTRTTGAFSGEIPLRVDLGFDWRVLGAAALVACASGIVAGLAPAVYAFRADINALLKTGGRTHAIGVDRSRFRRALIVGQIAVSLVLLVTGALFMKSLDRARRLDLGFNADRLLLADVQPALNGYTPAERLALYRRVRDRVTALPAVRSVDWISSPPFASDLSDTNLFVEGRPPASRGAAPFSFLVRTSPGYLDTAGVRLIGGRRFTEQDDGAHRQVMLVNETLARQLWPGENPIGRRARMTENGPWVEVVGVVKDGKYVFVWEAPRPMVFRPIAQETPGIATLVVRTAGAPGDAADEVRRAFRDVDPDLLVSGIRSMASHLEQGNAFIIFRIGALLSGLFGVMGLLLASIGLYGVIAYHVTQRSHEIGVRMALGARPSAIVGGVLARGARLASAGAAVGIVLTAAIGRFVRPLLLGVSPFDPAAYASVTLVLVAVALLASVVPARRAVTADPLECLRKE